LFSSTKYLEQHIATLEKRCATLENELAANRAYTQQLVDRLLLKERVPEVVPKAAPVDPKAVEALLETADVFADEDGDEIEDNRKEHLSGFVS
jgi:hypothetical protein